MVDNIWAVPLALSNFNIVVAVLGGFISLFGLVSYLLKENYYLSEARKFAPSFACSAWINFMLWGEPNPVAALFVLAEQHFIRLHEQHVLDCPRHDSAR